MLVKAFTQANISNLKLVLCGDGDYADKLREIAAEQDSIQYLGVVPHDQVLALEVEAELLVDPRPSNMIVSKMSFPSKIIEYMASGTPVLTTNLPCYADEYRRYQYRIEEDNVSGIKDALQHVFAIPETERIALGRAAKTFIYKSKTMHMQCGKIMGLIDEVSG